MRKLAVALTAIFTSCAVQAATIDVEIKNAYNVRYFETTTDGNVFVVWYDDNDAADASDFLCDVDGVQNVWSASLSEYLKFQKSVSAASIASKRIYNCSLEDRVRKIAKFVNADYAIKDGVVSLTATYPSYATGDDLVEFKRVQKVGLASAIQRICAFPRGVTQVDVTTPEEKHSATC